MSEIVKRLRKAHDENMDRSFSPPLETQTSVDFHYAALKIEDLEAEITRLSTALENARKENAELKSTVVAFAGPHAVEVAKFHGLPKNHLLSNHYDLLAKCGGRMVDFVRSEEHS